MPQGPHGAIFPARLQMSPPDPREIDRRSQQFRVDIRGRLTDLARAARGGIRYNSTYDRRSLVMKIVELGTATKETMFFNIANVDDDLPAPEFN
jgi:hypothetical protein